MTRHPLAATQLKTPLMALIMMLLAGLLVTGCSSEPDPQEADVSTKQSQAQVLDALREVSRTSAAAGYTLPAATGSWSTCGSEPLPTIGYADGGVTDPGSEGTAAAITELTAALESEGWEPESAGETTSTYANLTRDDLRVALGESRREPGAVSVSGPCVEYSHEQDSLLGQKDQIDLAG